MLLLLRQLGFVLATGVTWDTVLRLVQAELKVRHRHVTGRSHPSLLEQS